jgi:predicted AAA+ superfamily ATPase
MANGTPPPYRPRLVDPLLDELFSQLSALMVIGPRAAGKTTSAGRGAATVVRLDREAEAVAFAADPDAALRGLPEPILLDEWQAVPGVLGAVKRAVDAEPRPGRFLLTGSVRAELENEVWPGTGRLVRLAMYPMTVREQLGRLGAPTLFDRLAAGSELTVPPNPPDLRGYVELALRGGFPDPALRLSGQPRQAWLESYVDDLLTHDVEALEQGRRDSRRLRRYFEAYALSSGGLADRKTVYDAAGVNKVTALAYEGLLDNLLVAEAVPAWRSNRLKRLVHQPKRYLIDPALIAAALRLDVHGVMRDGEMLGRVLDTFVAAQLRPELATSTSRPRLHHLRTEQGRHEVDLVAELAGGGLIGIEVKAGAAPGAGDAKHLAWLREELGERFLAGVVLHTGPRLYGLGERIVAAPICSLWGT